MGRADTEMQASMVLMPIQTNPIQAVKRYGDREREEEAMERKLK